MCVDASVSDVLELRGLVSFQWKRDPSLWGGGSTRCALMRSKGSTGMTMSTFE